MVRWCEMPEPIRADYDQLLLLPPDMGDWLAPDHPARFLCEFVDLLDLDALGFHVPQCRTGRPPFACDLLLKVWLYGYFERIRSVRRLERACYNMVPMIWLTGMNYPDHNTIWRFFDANRRALRGVFKQSTQVACRSGMVGAALHALDGTKITARASRRTGWHKDSLLKSLDKLDGALDQIMAEIESTCAAEQSDPEYRMPPHLQDAACRREQIQAALAQLEATGSQHLHPADPEAPMMKSSNGPIEFAYNAQLVVDADTGIVVAQDVTDEATDTQQLAPMLDQVQDNGIEVAQQTVADGGYWNPQQLAQAEQDKREVLVNAPAQVTGTRKGDGEFHKSRFRYDGEKDVFVCPEGEELTFQRTKSARHNKQEELRIYRCHHHRQCPWRDQCTSDARGRCIEKGPHHEAVVRQVQKQKRPQMAALMRRRGQSVELAFARAKQQEGLRRWSGHGLANVRAQWTLLCTTLNLRKMHKKWAEGGLTVA